MPVFRPVPSETVRKVLEHYGWEVVDEDNYNWLFVSDDETLTVPKALENLGFVSLKIMDHIYKKTGLSSIDFYGIAIDLDGTWSRDDSKHI